MSSEQTVINTFTFNNEDNGGESLCLSTIIHDFGGNAEITQELSLQSYGRSATFNFGFDLTPSKLRDLANQLESAIINYTNTK